MLGDRRVEPECPSTPILKRKEDKIPRKSASVPALAFLENSFYKKGFLIYGEDRPMFGLWQRQYYIRLNATHLTAYRDETSDRPIRNLDVPLEEMQAIKLLPPDNPFGEFSFALHTPFHKYVFTAQHKEEMAEWIIAIDGILSNILSNSFNTFLEPVSAKKKLLQCLYRDPYKGGVITSSYGEEWEYRADGTIVGLNIDGGSKILYEWDGELFTPAKEDGANSHGAGQWNGVWCGWYLDDWMVLKLSGRREKFLKYFFDQKEREFIPENKGLTVWKWARHFLASKSNEGYWAIEGSVPEPVTMFLQLIRYSRLGYDVKDNEEISSPSWKRVSVVNSSHQCNQPEFHEDLQKQSTVAIATLIVSIAIISICVFKLVKN